MQYYTVVVDDNLCRACGLRSGQNKIKTLTFLDMLIVGSLTVGLLAVEERYEVIT